METAEKRKLIIIAGPTASGKSDAAVRLAKEIGGEIISADSVQVYRGMDIGSAKITEAEMQGVPHHLIDVIGPETDYNVAVFKEMAGKALEQIYAAGHIPILCGGTGFYIQALLYDIDFTEEEPTPEEEALRKELEALAGQGEKGAAILRERLKAEDPESCAVLDLHNLKKVIRALMFMRLHGFSIQEHNRREAEKRENAPFDYRFFVLYSDRRAMYERINRRVDRMLEGGLVEEVQRLKALGLCSSATSVQAIGYKELFVYLDGKCSLEQAAEQIKTNTRRFAKKQLTWFKREKNTIWINIDEGDPIAAIREYL